MSLAVMVEPSLDLEDRSVVWNELQYFWMDTDPELLLDYISTVCARSKYSIEQLEAIFWNEVRPAVTFNLRSISAPDWSGFDIKWLKARVLEKHKFGCKLPRRWLHRSSNEWWTKLRGRVEALRAGSELAAGARKE